MNLISIALIVIVILMAVENERFIKINFSIVDVIDLILKSLFTFWQYRMVKLIHYV